MVIPFYVSSISFCVSTEILEPPTEESLLQNTLWPEIQKLYGHGYEIYSLAAAPDGQLLASACKATNVEHAAILLWYPHIRSNHVLILNSTVFRETNDWNQIQKLPSHNLTVAQLAFSPNSQFLLSVSRDRRWSLFARKDNSSEFTLFATVDKRTSIHTRIIWCCAWTHDSRHFATGSRDGKVVVWKKNENLPENIVERYIAASQSLELKGESVTAVAFAPNDVNNNYLIAIGLESGAILIYKWAAMEWNRVLLLNQG